LYPLLIQQPISFTVDWTSAPFFCYGKIKIDGGEFCGKKSKDGCDGACGGIWRSLMLVHLAEYVFSRRECVFTFNLFKKSINVIL
jgi:hypothetical protein